MRICIPNETSMGEARTAMVPTNVSRLTKLGAEVQIESGAGAGAGYSDESYAAAGAGVQGDRRQLLSEAAMLLRLRKPSFEEVEMLKPGCVHISFLDPFNELELVEKMASRGISAISMEMIPRITRAQKMDALTSQANLAGYVAAILGATHLNRIFPMLMTAAGTIPPARVFVIGAGVAGLQAIATAKRLGAKVEAFDTRPVVEEQVRSLGARFVKIDLGTTGQTKEGYAQALSAEQLQKQCEAMKRVCADSDLVISTAQVFGRKAPIIVTAEMLAAMKRGSVVVDLAIESGGNVEGAVFNQITERQGVKIIALANMAGRVPLDASQVYSNNLTNLVAEFWEVAAKGFVLKLEDEIIRGCLVTHGGKVCHEKIIPLLKR